MQLERELAVAIAAAQAAGRVAAQAQATTPRRDKPDGSPVSDADVAAETEIRRHLASAFPQDAILGEETADDALRLGNRRLWITDPIDGTRDFLAGQRDWAVQLALAIDGELALGVLDLPGYGACVAGIVGVGAFLCVGDRREALVPAPVQRNRLICSRSERNRAGVEAVLRALPEFTWLPTSSVGAKVWLMLRGEADLFVHPRPIAEWDVAAPAAVLRAAGGIATDLAGGALRFNTASGKCPGLSFSRRDDHAALVARLASGGVRA